MKDILNGAYLGDEYNWDNDLCKKVVSQKYRVSIGESKVSEYYSPLGCYNFVKKTEELGYNLKIEEFVRPIMGMGSFRNISKERLEKILNGEEKPMYILVPRFTNPNFSPICDIGD